jgi:hypothetical protein
MIDGTGPKRKTFRPEALAALPALVYLTLSLMIGECHPFSRYRMYESLSKEAHLIILRDKEGHLLPLRPYFRLGAADLSHMYDAAVREYGEDSLQIGTRLCSQLAQRALEDGALPPLTMFKLHLKAGDSKISMSNQLIYQHIPYDN